MFGRNFFDVARTRLPTSEGPVDLPILYYDASMRHMVYLVEPEPALRALEGTGLLPCRIAGGKAMAGIVLFEYRDTSIGPYNEVAVAVMACPAAGGCPRLVLPNFLKKDGRRWDRVGAHILELPVTTAAACAAGREIWGYPKFVTQIPAAVRRRQFTFEVGNPEGGPPLISVHCHLGPGLPLKTHGLATLSHFAGAVLKTAVDVDASIRGHLAGDVEISLGDSGHPMEETVRNLGLHRRKPLLVLASDSFRTRLNLGEVAAPWPTPLAKYGNC